MAVAPFSPCRDFDSAVTLKRTIKEQVQELSAFRRALLPKRQTQRAGSRAAALAPYNLVTKAAIVAAWLLAAGALPVGAGESGVVASVALTKTTFLSTEEAQAKIAVFNGTATEMTVDLGDVTFRTYSQGQSQSRRACNRDCWRSFSRVAPGAHKEVKINLPSCEVISDPCSESGVMQYPITIGQERHVYTAALPQYWFVPDPSAVYRDVKDALPVLVAFGTAPGTIAPSGVAIDVVAAPSPAFSPNAVPAELFSRVEKALRDAGVSTTRRTDELDNPARYVPATSGGYMHVPGGYPKPDTWRAVFTVENVSPVQLSAIGSAVRAIRERFGAQLSKIGERVVFSALSDQSDVWKHAQDNAEPQARRLLALIRGGELDWTKTGRTAGSLSYVNPVDAHYTGDVEIVLDDLKALTALDVIARAQVGYQATKPANVRIDPAIAARARASFRPGAMPTLAPAAEMAVDRPEIYATGGASMKASLQAGLSPDAVALLNARANTAEFAKLLGVRVGAESLFTLYNPDDTGDPTIGVATTFSGGDARASAASEMDPNVQMFRNNHPDTRTSIPIEIPAPETTVTESAWAQTKVDAKLLRFEIEVEGNEAPPNVDANKVNAELRAVPGVLATALTTQFREQNLRFEVLPPRNRRSLIAKLAAISQTAYTYPAAYTSFSLEPFIGDCPPIKERLLKLTIYQNWMSAQADARAAHRPLRKLLLAAPFPGALFADEVSACYPLARDPGGLAYRHIDDIPSALQPARFAASSLMVFRTFRQN
jgi:hypothetical protein